MTGRAVTLRLENWFAGETLAASDISVVECDRQVLQRRSCVGLGHPRNVVTLIVLTKLSAIPLLCGLLTGVVIGFMPISRENVGVSSAMSKAALAAMTQSLAMKWGGRGIRFNAIAPGVFPAEGMTARLNPNGGEG